MIILFWILSGITTLVMLVFWGALAKMAYDGYKHETWTPRFVDHTGTWYIGRDGQRHDE